MRITSLTLRNFKAIGPAEQRVDFRPITLLYGPNSAGKSTIVQALHYLSEVLSRNNCDPGTTRIGGKLNLGGFRNLVHLHDPDTTIELGLGLSLDDSLLPGYGGEDEEEHLLLGEVLGSEQLYDLNQVASVAVRLGVRWSQQLQQAYVSDYAVAVNDEAFAHITATGDQKRIVLSALNCDHAMFRTPLTEDDEAISVGEALQGLLDEYVTAPVGVSGEPVASPLQLRFGRGAMPVLGSLLPLAPATDRLDGEEMDPRRLLREEEREQAERREAETRQAEQKFAALNRYLSRLIVGAGELAQDCLQQFIYLGPLRDIPGRHYSPELSPGLGRWSSGLGAWDQLYNEGEALAGKVNAWLADDKRLDAGYEIHYSEYKPLPLDSALMVALQSGSELLEAGDWIRTRRCMNWLNLFCSLTPAAMLPGNKQCIIRKDIYG